MLGSLWSLSPCPHSHCSLCTPCHDIQYRWSQQQQRDNATWWWYSCMISQKCVTWDSGWDSGTANIKFYVESILYGFREIFYFSIELFSGIFELLFFKINRSNLGKLMLFEFCCMPKCRLDAFVFIPWLYLPFLSSSSWPLL